MVEVSQGRGSTLPFVGCLEVNGKGYIYDVNTNEILAVEPRDFSLVVEALNDPREAGHLLNDQSIQTIRRHGYLSAHYPRGVRAPCRHCLEKDHRSKLGQCTLELTQACNHRCLYCPYSSLDATRRPHSQKCMSWEIAEAAIDLLLDHSEDAEHIALGFYGGEPLLAWGLLRRCLEYAHERAGARPLLTTLTTNATLAYRS